MQRRIDVTGKYIYETVYNLGTYTILSVVGERVNVCKLGACGGNSERHSA